MSHEKFEEFEEHENFAHEASKEKRVLICPENHENPCVWQYACDYCKARCAEEKAAMAQLERRRKEGQEGIRGGD